jgi:hypothetical protein
MCSSGRDFIAILELVERAARRLVAQSPASSQLAGAYLEQASRLRAGPDGPEARLEAEHLFDQVSESIGLIRLNRLPGLDFDSLTAMA